MRVRQSCRTPATPCTWSSRTPSLRWSGSSWSGTQDRGTRGRCEMTATWSPVRPYDDIIYEHADGIAKITINRAEVRNAFRPKTLFEMSEAFSYAHEDPDIGVIILTGAGTEAFCSGGDQRVRGEGGDVGGGGGRR